METASDPESKLETKPDYECNSEMESDGNSNAPVGE